MVALDHIGGIGTINPALEESVLVASKEFAKLQVLGLDALVLDNISCPREHCVVFVCQVN